MKTFKLNTNESTEKSPSKLLNSLKFLAPVVLAAILSTGAQAQSVLYKCIENGNDINGNGVASAFEEEICQRFFEGQKLDEEGQKLDEEGQKLDEEGQKLDEEGQKLDKEGQKLDEEIAKLHQKLQDKISGFEDTK